MVLESDVIQSVIAEIKAAFSGLSPPDDARLLHPQCKDDGDIMDFYGALDRWQLTDDTIISNYAAPSFFSKEAFQYFMPAFMIWSLNHYDTDEYAPESTIRAFDPTNGGPGLFEFQISKFALFTEQQRAAVVQFLHAFSADPDLGPIAGDALNNYWLRQDPVSK
jgi:hypothetical protein